MVNNFLATSYYLNSTSLKYLLIAFGVAGCLALLGLFLRSKVKLFQKLFLPASVIAGFIGLILGPEVLGKIPAINAIMVSVKDPETGVRNYTLVEQIIKIFDAIPGILIIPIFASSSLGNFKKKAAKGAKKEKTAFNWAPLGVFFALQGVMFMQMAVGLGTNLLFTKIAPSMEIYSQFGYEVALGFVGGHGTVAGIPAIFGSFFADKGSLSMGVGTSFATFGLVGGMILGIIFINVAARKGKTAIMNKPAKFSDEELLGLHKNIEKQGSCGRETTKNYAIETITVHLAIIVGVCLAAYGVNKLLGSLPKVGQLLGSVPVWTIAMLLMFGVNALLQALKLEWLIDRRLVSKISGTMTDFAIICAIASMPLSAVLKLMGPILVASAVAFVLTYFMLFKYYDWLLGGKDGQSFEHGIISWGTCTGVMMTGLMLLKICDPENKSTAVPNFAKGFAAMSITQTLTLVILLPIFAKGTMPLFLYAVIGTAIFAVGAVISAILANVSRKKATAK